MDVKTYRAATMHEALAMVRRDLGPDAAVLHTREVITRRFLGWLPGPRQIEVTASTSVNVPSRLPRRVEAVAASVAAPESFHAIQDPPETPPPSPPASFLSHHQVTSQLSDLQAMLQELCKQSRSGRPRDLPDSLFRSFADLIEADLSEEIARELIERVRNEVPPDELAEPARVKARIARMIESEIPVTGPIAVNTGRRRLVALVGPTGVGKTTTIAKLAANYRLKQKRNVGLITVDTYRIAAVEQLRTYADIIDLPMQVVSTPKEMRDAVRQMSDLDLILLDTAGRSPKDSVKIQELRAFLTEAAADEVHLVLSAMASARALEQTAQQFAMAGTTALVLTKLDEASGLGNVLPLVRSSRLPLSYLTNGQNVPDDIEVARPDRVARLLLGLDSGVEA